MISEFLSAVSVKSNQLHAKRIAAFINHHGIFCSYHSLLNKLPLEQIKNASSSKAYEVK